MRDKTKFYLEKLISTLKINHKGLRYAIVETMLYLNENEAVPLLIKRLKKDKDWRIRDTARYILEKISKDRGYTSIDDFIVLVEKKYKSKGHVWDRYKGEIIVGLLTGGLGLISTLLAIFLS